MGNKLVSPFPSYETACSHLNPMEMAHLKNNFKLLCKAGDSLTINQFTQNCQVNAVCSKYIRKHIFPRLFGVVDQRRDSVIDFEEYLSAVALFRVGSTEEKIRVLFLMYEPVKGVTLMRENLRKLLVDATVAVQREEVDTNILERWIEEQMELSDTMADMVIQQFAAQDGKLDFQEFAAFAKVEGSVQGLLHLLPGAIDF